MQKKEWRGLMMLSNIALLIPVFVALWYGEILYLFFGLGIVTFSPLFHWYRIKHRGTRLYWIFRTDDWLFAVGSFFYMYWYVFRYLDGVVGIVFYALLLLLILFFYYGWRYGNYEKVHPYFHILAPLVSAAILIAAH